MSETQETGITRNLIKMIKHMGGDAYHVHGSGVQRSGEPDIDGYVPSEGGGHLATGEFVHLKVEVKTPEGKPDRLQLYRLDRYVKAGYCAGIVTEEHELYMLIDEFSQYGHNTKSWRNTLAKYTNRTMVTSDPDDELRLEGIE